MIDSIAFPRPDLMICPGDVLLCLRVNLRSCKNGDFISCVCSSNSKALFHHLSRREVPAQLALELIIQALHRNHARLSRLQLPVQLLHKPRPMPRATPQASPSNALRVRNVHREAARQNLEVEADPAQMLQPLHFVVPIVDEPLIEPREMGRPFHHHVSTNQIARNRGKRLLFVAFEALHRRQKGFIIIIVPLSEEIVLRFPRGWGPT